MGNSPSKNDPLPNTSALRSAGSSSDMIAGDVESDETSASPLSRPTGNGRNTPRESRDSRTFNSGATAPGQPRASVGGSVSQKSQSAPQNIPARGSRERRKSSHGSDPDLSMDIDASLALLLSNSASGGASPSAATSGWKKANGRSHLVPNVSTGLLHVPARAAASVSEPGAEYGSSLDSQKSEILSGSPLFTGSERDTSLLLSLYLETGLPSVIKTENPFAAVLKSSLDPIAENSIESTPEPKRTEAKPQAIKKSKLVDSTLVKQQSQAVTPVSLSPPMLPQAKKTDFDIDGIIERLIAIGRNKDAYKHLKSRKMKDKLPLTSQEVKSVLAKSRLIFLDQPSLLKLAPPVKIVGDIHGQFFDLIRIFDSCGYPPYTNYLFLGDYVDRGYKSLEVILLLLCYKIKYPENFFMLRGNHESANITKIYGFYDECKRRLPLISGSHKLWKCFIDVFNTLPIAATINDKIFCIHGGLSPELHSLKQVEQIQRPTDIPDRGLLADLLWSDPDASVRTFSLTNWPKNDRGVSYCFGKKHVDYFLSKFNMDLIVRGHMVVEDGYEFFNKRKLVTVFLAPNYCGDFNNYGAVMSVDKSLCCSFELIKPQ